MKSQSLPPPPRLGSCWSSKCCRLSLKRTLTRSGLARVPSTRRHLCGRGRVQRNHDLAVSGGVPHHCVPPQPFLDLWTPVLTQREASVGLQDGHGGHRGGLRVLSTVTTERRTWVGGNASHAPTAPNGKAGEKNKEMEKDKLVESASCQTAVANGYPPLPPPPAKLKAPICMHAICAILLAGDASAGHLSSPGRSAGSLSMCPSYSRPPAGGGR